MDSIKEQSGRYGDFGGRYAPELLIQPLLDLQGYWEQLKVDSSFLEALQHDLVHYAGRPTPLTEAPRLAKAIGAPRVFLKREDLLHTGAHKLNNALGQCLLAKAMGKTRIIAETGAGQHGVATATACARLGLCCTVYMGRVDVERQAPNVARMYMLGAKVIAVESGTGRLKDAINEAMRDWAHSYDNTHYCIGSVLGPHPYPEIVATLQRIIGDEAREQMLTVTGELPTTVVACVGGGSNAIGIFTAFLDDASVELVGVEAGGLGPEPGRHAARFSGGSRGVFHGCYTYLLQDDNGQIQSTHSVSAGMDYPAVGPQHAALHATGQCTYTAVTDDQAVEAMHLLARTEGIIPALESSHAIAYATQVAPQLLSNAIVLINLSGRGDKDLGSLQTVSTVNEGGLFDGQN
ncbi:Tryptophan synthase beta chain 2 [Chlamydiales bacterium SCGC AG-110-P3]|nr:Tryptophan synthase beta chain 2 [Chlamydiales bacterium SCGC AG-110-P3]